MTVARLYREVRIAYPRFRGCDDKLNASAWDSLKPPLPVGTARPSSSVREGFFYKFCYDIRVYIDSVLHPNGIGLDKTLARDLGIACRPYIGAWTVFGSVLSRHGC